MPVKRSHSDSFEAASTTKQASLDCDPLLSNRRAWLIHRLMASIIGLSMLAMVLHKELWPFSPYTMYSEMVFAGETVEVYRLFAVAESTAEEFLIANPAQLQPFNIAYLGFAFKKLHQKEKDIFAVQRAMKDCFDRYERHRNKGKHDGPPLQALRLYRLALNHEGELRDRYVQTKTLLAEVHKSEES